MRVCIVNDLFQASAPGGMYRIQGMAQALRDLGHSTVQVCPFFTVEGDATFPAGNSYADSLNWYLRNSGVLLRRLRGIDADVFLVELPFPWTKALVAIVKSFQGERVFLDFGEYWIEAANRCHSALATKVIEVASRTSAGVSVTTQALAQWLVEHFRLPLDRVFYLPCGVSSDILAQGASRHGSEAGDRTAGLVVGYAGTISDFQGCDRLLDIVAEVLERNPQIRFLVVGDGPLLERLRKWATESGLDPSVTFTGRVDRTKLPALLAQMDIGLSLKPPLGVRTMGTFPQKIPEYMAVGCVPISTPLQEAKNIISPGVNGVIANIESMADVIVSLSQDDKGRERMSRLALESARLRYDWKNLVGGLVRFWGDQISAH